MQQLRPVQTLNLGGYLYLKDVSNNPPLAAREQKKLARCAKRGDPSAKKKMVETNLRLVIKIARQYLHKGLSFEDVIEEGNLGLLKAVDKYDPDLGFKFSTYAVWWIRQAIERAIMNQGRLIRLPVYIHKAVSKALKENRKHRFEQYHAFINQIDSLDQLAEQLTTDLENPYQNVEAMDLKQAVLQFLTYLTRQQKAILIARFGLLGQEPCTLKEVSARVDLSRERVRQLQVAALKKLRTLLHKKDY